MHFQSVFYLAQKLGRKIDLFTEKALILEAKTG
jgi:predicted nucleotidyltransferase